MRFIGRWLSQGIGMALSLLFAIMAMQAPAFTRDYAGALQQVTAELRRDIDQRQSAARRYYGLGDLADDEFLKALAAHEPANAETLGESIDRGHRLNAASVVIAQSAPLLRPLVALGDAWHDPDGSKAAIWKLALRNYIVQLDFSFAAAVYGFAGLMLGSLIAEALRAALRGRAWRLRVAHRTR